ncbi:hypothetical protein ACFH04_06540 [Streptomyces noboritoensis]|uniref:Uncharacterized protein n=1 Tax=Streptomyces noboritoensis TaxID=67337 RepID=A0ABV6TFX4_9ACTN
MRILPGEGPSPGRRHARAAARPPTAPASLPLPHAPHPGESPSAVGEAGPDGGWQCLPVELELEKAPMGGVEDGLLASVGGNPASLGWWPLKWPAMPELGRSNYTGGYAWVEITINCRGLYLEKPSDDHTVYVHVQSQDLQRARWLAARIGRDIMGEPLFAG